MRLGSSCQQRSSPSICERSTARPNGRRHGDELEEVSASEYPRRTLAPTAFWLSKSKRPLVGPFALSQINLRFAPAK